MTEQLTQMFPLYHFGKSFIMNRYWILSNAFSTSIEMIMWFSSFVTVAYHIDCICRPLLVTLGWIQLGRSVWFFILCVVVFGLLILCWEFLHLYSPKIQAFNFPFWWCLCLALVSWWWWLHRMYLGVFLSLHSYGRVWEGWV